MLVRYASIFEAVGGGEERICITCVSETKPRGYPDIPVKQLKGSKEGDLRVERRGYSEWQRQSEQTQALTVV